jgi:hypothetical protein
MASGLGPRGQPEQKAGRNCRRSRRTLDGVASGPCLPGGENSGGFVSPWAVALICVGIVAAVVAFQKARTRDQSHSKKPD